MWYESSRIEPLRDFFPKATNSDSSTPVRYLTIQFNFATNYLDLASNFTDLRALSPKLPLLQTLALLLSLTPRDLESRDLMPGDPEQI